MSRPHRLPMVVTALLLWVAAIPAWAVAGSPGSDPSVVMSNPSVLLKISFSDGRGRRTSARLTCRGSSSKATGFLRGRAARSCRQARRVAPQLTSTPSTSEPCAQLYGGPEKARIRGTIDSVTLDRRFTRGDGCAIDAWDRVGVLLPTIRGGR